MEANGHSLCDTEGHSERFGVIEFAVSADVSPAFRQAVYEVAEDNQFRSAALPDRFAWIEPNRRT